MSVLRSGIVLLAAITGLVMGVYEAYVLVRGEKMLRSAANWVEVPATIEAFNLVQERGVGVHWRVRYFYEYNGRSYSSDRDNFFTDWHSSLTHNYIVVNTKVAGALKVHVDPQQPEQSVRTLDYYSASELRNRKIGYALLAGVSALALTLMIHMNRKRQARSSPS